MCIIWVWSLELWAHFFPSINKGCAGAFKVMMNFIINVCLSWDATAILRGGPCFQGTCHNQKVALHRKGDGEPFVFQALFGRSLYTQWMNCRCSELSLWVSTNASMDWMALDGYNSYSNSHVVEDVLGNDFPRGRKQGDPSVVSTVQLHHSFHLIYKIVDYNLLTANVI